ncbi:hypothetical protein BDZ91DRAFT_52300 [Kalaharituber pfeilii]|nr:hypothetical protein BDZ91DRAFT_52300 [Kalaharituber pfeilii]
MCLRNNEFLNDSVSCVRRIRPRSPQLIIYGIQKDISESIVSLQRARYLFANDEGVQHYNRPGGNL